MNAIIGLCHFCELHGPSVLFCTQAFHSQEPELVLEPEESHSDVTAGVTLKRSRSVTESSTSSTGEHSYRSSDSCEACRSLQNGFISHDSEAKVRYISNQQPDHPQVFSMVRQACVRSLSCEVCPGREGPIFFGDEHGGNVLSYTFYIKDSQARGFQRWYSIIVVMMDKIFLLNSWPFLVKHIEAVITEIQSKALKVYEKEQAKCPQRAQRLTMSINPANFRQTRGATKPARSLLELTNDKRMFRRLHQSFAWMLKAGGNRLTERLLEGPPTEDSIIDLEKQEETEEGFVKLFAKKISVETPQESVKTVEQILAEEPEPKFRNVRHVLQVLEYQTFHSLAQHTVIGNQVIVQGKHKGLVISMIEAIKVLLPRGCCKVVPYSDRYEDSWKCNFLGLSENVTVPQDIEHYVMVNIFSKPKQVGNHDNDLMENFTFELASPVILPEQAPAVLTKMEYTLLNDQLDDNVVEHGLICIKEEWMNKVKVLFKFTKAGGNKSEDDTKKLYQVVDAKDEDQGVLKFWMTGLSVQYRNHMLSAAKSDSH